MKKLYNKVKNDRWEAGEICMSVISKFGTGGGNVPIVLESNQNHARAEETEVCPTIPASMGLGGGYVPMIVVEECVSYLHAEEADVCFPLRAQGGGLPMVVDTMIFDESQITSPANRSAVTWGTVRDTQQGRRTDDGGDP